jgi:cytochrome c-type protein NapB
MSHTAMASCTQCHVVEEAPMPGGADLPPDPRDVGNAFVGLPSPTAGPRAWDVAPPQVPHRTFMRENCDSCHGVNGRDALRSSHPWRESCEQCHAASAQADGRPGVPR